MARTPSLPRFHPGHALAAFLHRVGMALRMRRGARQMDALPRERCADIGIAPVTEANRRHSGAAGRLPVPPLW